MDRWIENLDHTLASAMEINFASNVETQPQNTYENWYL